MKKLLSVILALALVLTLALPLAQAEAVEEGSFACNPLADLAVCISVHRIGKTRKISPFLFNPSYKFRYCGNVLHLRELLGRKH